ncbi:MAG: hypothetical protein MZV64_03425 [Ignavibacteriales bacterium]|nr:hypothetical protein [Ignavibacteriales bacterium]
MDGVSMMTVAATRVKYFFEWGIIPFTWQETIFSNKKVGDTVNLEFDVLGKVCGRLCPTKAEVLIKKLRNPLLGMKKTDEKIIRFVEEYQHYP